MASKLNSLEICAELQKSGTGEEALNFLESVLHDHFVNTRMQKGVAELLSPDDLLAKFVSHDKIDHWTGTVEKIKSLIQFGEIRVVQAAATSRLWDIVKNDAGKLVEDAKTLISDVKNEASNEFAALKGKVDEVIFGPKSDPEPAPLGPADNVGEKLTTLTSTKLEPTGK